MLTLVVLPVLYEVFGGRPREAMETGKVDLA
jgi:hypothetical protein